jgi:hypothetical protein
VQTVEENKSIFSPRQISKAKNAQDLYHMIGRPSYQDFIGIVKNNLLLNNGVRIEDVAHPEQIFRKDLRSIQGKTTRVHPDVVIADYVMVPPYILPFNEKIKFSVDIMTIDTMIFLITTLANIQFTTVECLANETVSTLEKTLDKDVRLYKLCGFIIKVCLADLEFNCVRDHLMSIVVILNTCGPNEHVPNVERKVGL